MKRTLLYALGLVALGGLGTAYAQDAPAAKVDIVVAADAKTTTTVVPASQASPIGMPIMQPAGSSMIMQTNGSCSGPGCSGPGCISQACGDCGCNSCCNDCGCEQGGGFYAAIGFYYFRPQWEDNSSFTVTSITPNNNNTVDYQFGYEFEFSPRIVLGFVGDTGLGGRICWWRFDQSANAALTLPRSLNPINIVSVQFDVFFSDALGVGQAENFIAVNDVYLDVWDLDVTQDLIDNKNCRVVGGAGIRYTHLAQNYAVYRNRTGLPAGTIDNAAGIATSNFNGFGPTVFFDATRCVGCGGMSLYANARGGVLFGDADQNQFTVFRAGPAGNPVVQTSQNLNSRHDLLPVFEGELGVQYQGNSDCSGGMVPFARLGLAGQSWFGAGNATSNSSNLGFVGLSVLAGVTY